MSTTETVVLIVVIVLVLAVVASIVWQQRKRSKLKEQFGPEYERTVSHTDRRSAERDLAERAERREELDIRPLPDADRRAFAARWRQAQQDFVDRPSTAIREADLLVAEVMSRRGYPVGDFDQQVRDVSVDHGHVVEEYRAAHDISILNDRGEASTEHLRQAMVHYRALFADLLDEGRGDGTRGDGTGDDAERPTEIDLRDVQQRTSERSS